MRRWSRTGSHPSRHSNTRDPGPGVGERGSQHALHGSTGEGPRPVAPGHDRRHRAVENAVPLDRTFSRAYAELALACGTLDDATDPLVRCPRAKAAATRAIALNGSSAPALAARGFVQYRCDWQWTRADADFAKAIATVPGDAFARHQFGVFLATLGRTEDALRELGRAAELEPGSAAIRADMVAPLLREGRVADA